MTMMALSASVASFQRSSVRLRGINILIFMQFHSFDRFLSTSQAEEKTTRETLRESRWNSYMDALREFVRENGHAHVPKTHPKLGRWVDNLRTQYRISQTPSGSGSMSEDRIKQLDSVGFVWNMHEQSWDKHYRELEQFYKEHGHTLVPNVNVSPLGKFVHLQRRNYQKRMAGEPCSLTDERLEQLNKLEFIWDAREASWMERYNELCRYRDNHGNCSVPKAYDSNPALGRWVDNQRLQYGLLKANKKGGGSQTVSLSKERIELLNKIDFIWNAYDAAWMQKYLRLLEFVRINGPVSGRSVPKDPSLANWIRKQRQLYRKRIKGEKVSLTRERIEKLEELEFSWET